MVFWDFRLSGKTRLLDRQLGSEIGISGLATEERAEDFKSRVAG